MNARYHPTPQLEKRETNYTRFVIVSQQRTGSTLLQMLFASHSNICSLGELFNPREEIRKKSLKVAKHLKPGDDPIEYLENYVYREYPEHIKAVGFKLFYDHARNSKWKPIWDYLSSSRIRIIHLKRRNLLDRYLSLQLAKRSDEWIAFKGHSRSSSEPILLDPAKCLQDFHRCTWLQDEADNFFQANPKIELFYEDLSIDSHGECSKLQSFLGLELEELSTNMVKQTRKKKSELISNYEELKQKFHLYESKGWAKKEWLDFFETE